MPHKKSKLNQEQWNDVIAYYQAGHTLAECGRIWGFSGPYIGQVFQKMGVPRRKDFEPARPETAALAPSHTAALFGLTNMEAQPASASSEVSSEASPGRVSSRRRIIAVSDSDKKAEMLYEKDYE